MKALVRVRAIALRTKAAVKAGGVVLSLDGSFVAGCGLIAYGIWEIYRPAGLISAGLMMVASALILKRAVKKAGN